MTELRDVLARAMFDDDTATLSQGMREHYWRVYHADGDDEYYPHADSVLRALADLPDDVIEQAAKGIDPDAFTMTRDEYRSLYGAFPAGARMTAKGEVKAAFQAVFGGEQS